MKTLAQGETFHGAFVLLEDDGVAPAILVDSMYVMVVLSTISRVYYKVTSLPDGGIVSLGDGKYIFTVPPSATAKMNGQVAIEIKLFDAANSEVIIGQPENPREPLCIRVTPNKIHAEK